MSFHTQSFHQTRSISSTKMEEFFSLIDLLHKELRKGYPYTKSGFGKVDVMFIKKIVGEIQYLVEGKKQAQKRLGY